MKYIPHTKMKRIFIAVKIDADDALMKMVSALSQSRFKGGKNKMDRE